MAITHRIERMSASLEPSAGQIDGGLAVLDAGPLEVVGVVMSPLTK